MPDTIPTIFVVEDNEFLIKFYRIKLEKEGYSVIFACNGEEAMKKMQTEMPDIILLDLIMPKKCGLEVLAELKKDPKFQNIPVLVLTNLGQGEDMKKAMDAGADDYIVKADTSFEDIISKIEKHLKKKAVGLVSDQ
jgi:CheY-like chemotaxis protein